MHVVLGVSEFCPVLVGVGSAPQKAVTVFCSARRNSERVSLIEPCATCKTLGPKP